MSQLVFDPSKVMNIDYTKRTEYLDGLEAIKAAHKVLKEITYACRTRATPTARCT